MKLVITSIFFLTILLVVVGCVHASDHLEYQIHIDKDGTALWKIIQAADIDTPFDSWEDFEDRIVAMVDLAGERVARDMIVDLASLEMKTELFWETSSKTVVYRFRWLNFSIIEDGQISVGDVFSRDFFSSLYGNGELYITYPTDYDLNTISASPNERDDSTQTLHWYRSQDFLSSETRISFISRTGVNSDLPLLMGTSLAVVLTLALGCLILKQRNKTKRQEPRAKEGPPLNEVKRDQERILELLQSSGGILNQSEICSGLRFSKAKTSQLLAEMEKEMLIKRQKRGRNKIVFLMENKRRKNT